MKKIAILLVLFIITQILAGCQGQVNGRLSGLLDDIEDNRPEAAVSPSVGATGPNTADLAAAPPATNYYPDAGLPGFSSDTAIVLTDKLRMKLYLIDEYNPGICFGKQSDQINGRVAAYLIENAAMAEFVRGYYKLSSDLEIYSKVRQIEGVSLTRGQSGKYLYRFVDGQCCDLTTYEGEIDIINVSIFENLIKHNTKKTSC